MSKFTDRLVHGWNAFMNKDPTPGWEYGNSNYVKPDRIRLTGGNDKNIVTSVYNRLSLDVASCVIQHVRLDDNDRFLEQVDSGLNYCLTVSPNIDQTSRGLIQDIAMSMLDEGCVAVVPVDTNVNIKEGSFDINSLRTGRIIEWYPNHIKAEVYNERIARKETIILPKSSTAIVENPYYAIMNEPNSTAKRLLRKLTLLDLVDEQNGAGKLDLIIQLPYIIKTEARRQQAEKRRKDIESQLAGSKYGIAYTDGTEHVTQLNRSVDNQLLNQIEVLTRTLYSQLGITEEIMNGTADEKTMNNYFSRTIEPILSAIVDEMNRKFLTKTARTRKQKITFYQDPFKLVPTSSLAELADKFTRNEIMTSNEFRQIVGLRPSEDPNANALRNKNLSQSNEVDQLDVDGNVIQKAVVDKE